MHTARRERPGFPCAKARNEAGRDSQKVPPRVES